MKPAAIIFAALMLASSVATADEKEVPPGPAPAKRYTGLSVFANAGAIWADNATANFYSGRPENANTINRVLHSNTYGQQIWQRLVSHGQISPSAISNYNQLQVVEYANMYYRISYQIGMGIRNDYASGFGWLLRFDLARLNALGAFNLSSTNGTGILTNNHQYIRCGIAGREDRINIDFAILKTVPLTYTTDLEIDLGLNLNNCKVKDNVMEIDGAKYSILDVWDGQSPDVGISNYEYINQGGIGYGVFISAFIGYQMPSVGAIRLGYTCYHSKTVLQGYTAMGWHHTLGLRFEMNNFSFFNIK